MSMTPPAQPPAQPPVQPPVQPPMGWLRLVLQGRALTSSVITPTVTINGYRVPAQYGVNVIPVYAGPNRIDVSCQWLKTFGQATLGTTVPEGEQVQAFYAAPMHQFARGAIGFEKQKRPGVLGFVLLMAVVTAVVLAIVILPLL